MNCSCLRPGKVTEGIGNQGKNQDSPDHSTVEISQNNLKRTGDVKRLVVTEDFSE